MSLACSCIKQAGGLAQAVGGIIRAKLSCTPAQIASKALIGAGYISEGASKDVNISSVLTGVGDITDSLSVDYVVQQTVIGIGEIKSHASLNANLAANPVAAALFTSLYTDKFAGSFNDFGCNQKLYPIADVVTSLSGTFFVDRTNNASGIYQSVDEGIFTGTYHTQGGASSRISDDRATYIHPSSVYTNGNFRYKCEVTPPTATPKDSRLYIRASAPMSNYFSDVPPEFTITDITLEDPSGNLIIQYDDIKLRGDSYYQDPSDGNFTTYGTAPKINKLLLHTWESGYPFMQEASGYTLNMNFSSQCLDDPFSEGFDVGYEDTCAEPVSSADSDDYLALRGAPLSTQTQNLTTNPTHSIRISAIEICDSGAFNTLNENFVPFYMEVLPSGKRLEKCILPQLMPIYGFDTSVYPTVSSVWVGNNDYYSNLTVAGSKHLVNKLRDEDDDDTNIVLDSTGPIADSGKLVLRFGHEQSSPAWSLRNGAFSIGVPSTGAFDTAYHEEVQSTQNTFFTVDSLVLKVRAKKSSGSRDYALDVVGYSDDKVLNITSAVGGFLQNTSGVGDMPMSSGFNSVDDFALGGESLSDKDQYFESSGTNNDGGDHYQLSAPVVSGTDFAWYEVPLSVYEDNVAIGKSTDYSMSSYFEHLYLDIYPLPSGATIASVQLCVKYKPSNALQLHTVGSEKIARIEKDRSEGKIYPISRQSSDSIINTGPSYAPLSTISDVPHAFTTPSTIKSNYSRRWRGLEGTVNGPFDPDEFGFGFENPLVDYAFTSGFYKFDTDNGINIIPLVGTLSGVLTTSFSDYRFDNLGWRFKSDNLFADQLAGYTSDYTTTDWTALSNGGSNFQSHELYGQIADAFTSVIRISGDNSYINFGDVDITDEFGLYVRFTPDITVSGAAYDLFQSGVLFSKWGAGKDLEFALGYDDKKLCFFAKNDAGDVVTVKDTIDYDQYQYPLSVFVSHSNTSGTKLYTDNEISSGTFNVLRASSDPYTIATGSSDLLVGHSFGSGVGMNMFVSEIGISDRANFVHENADWTDKEVTVQEFLENNRVNFWGDTELYTDDDYKLWDRVNEDTLQWDLGAFKYCHFGIGFDGWTKRSGKDLVTFSINHHGSGYLDTTDKAMPSNVSSGVAYHTQIENDFLRFNLSDASSNFYSTDVRITKALPRGYHFSDRALVVETVINDKTFSDIVWEDGNIGPKLIVSLYSKNQDPKTYEKENWGLVNRAIHYIQPSSCMVRLDSTFDYNNLIDESEAWALFPPERTLTDFEHKYYAKDIDQMFLQYDLVYPSGEPFESRIDIHSAHIRLEDAFVEASGATSEVTLSVSGQKRPREELSLFAGGVGLVGYPSGTLNLYADANVTPLSGTLNLLTSGMVIETASLPLYTTTFFHVGVSDSGGYMPSGLNLYTYGEEWRSGNMPLYLENTQTVAAYAGGGGETLHFNIHGGVGAFSYMPMFLYNRPTASLGSGSAKSNLFMRGTEKLQSDYSDSYFNLFTLAPSTPSGAMNLVLYADPDYYEVFTTETAGSGSLNLYITNYGTSGSPALYWSSRNVGKDIDVSDNSYAALSADDEIRGVDLICYGDCDLSGTVKCEEERLYTHDTLWRDSVCVSGGIFRALDTYTNLAVSGFNTSVGYSGHYYGIRKYDNLIPGMEYNITVEGQTGSNNHIQLPREWEEWEYGSTDEINFSGFKFIGDYPLLSGTLPVDSGRNEDDRYGSDVAVKKDVMAVSAPNHGYDIYGESYLEEAGAIFVYRRKDMASSGDKAFWDLESKVVIPSSFRGDYSVRKSGTISFGGLPPIPVNQWHAGQKGRHLGHSVDISISGSEPSLGEDHKEILVAGAPDSSWSRDFDDIVTSGVQVGVMLFTDEFKYTGDKGNQIKNKVTQTNFIYRYYASPAVHLDLKVVVCQPTGVFGNSSPAGSQPLADFMFHKKIGRKYGATDEAVLSGIKEAFHEAFPYDATKVHNNIPPILGMYADDSRSLGRSDLEPAIDQFKQYYNDYSFLSGVRDWYGVQDSGHLYEFIPSTGAAEDWVAMSKTIMDELLDTGRLVSSDGLRFITSGIGLEFANPAASEFNAPAASGGRVYIFEKESGHWNLIQEINSPTPLAGSAGEFDGQDDFSGDGDEPVAPGNGDGAGDESGDDAGDDGLGAGADGGGAVGGGSSGEDDTEAEIFDENTQPDAFGHAVAISDNSEVITIGSPYMPVNNCLAYEYDPKEKLRLYGHIEDWLNYRNVGGIYDAALSKLDSDKAAYGELVAAQAAYIDLSPSDKFHARSDKNYWDNHSGIIEEYKKIFSYGYDNIAHTGTWQFIPADFAPTSRLGFSTTVSEDGEIIAFGAPTDSFNEFDDTNIYYKGYSTWSSYVNAGAVRVFESREYTPHSGVVEFFRFGNLDMSTGSGTANYDDLETIFENDGRSFRRTGFSELEIDDSVGLAFIITPEVDSASDEVIANLKDWLSLGDRTLVLVGNDPVWEDNGKYEESNAIVNKILSKLDSHLRLHPARSEYESLPSCSVDVCVKYQVPTDIGTGPFAVSGLDVQYELNGWYYPVYTESGVPIEAGSGVHAHSLQNYPGITFFMPQDAVNHGQPTSGEFSPFPPPSALNCLELEDRPNLVASFIPENTRSTEIATPTMFGRGVADVKIYATGINMPSPCDEHNLRCELPLKDGGDLRAQWRERCGDVYYKRNWALEYGSVNPCDFDSFSINRPNEEPRPLLVAAEYISGYIINYPSWDETVETPVYKTRVVGKGENTVRYSFADEHVDEIDFLWSEASGNHTSENRADFLDPAAFNDRDSLIQGVGQLKDTDPPIRKERVVHSGCIMAAEEAYTNGSNVSKVVVIAAVTPENEDNMTAGYDHNVSFYQNLVMKDCATKGSIMQVGGWTGRTSFTDAYSKSILGDLFFFKGNTVNENWTSPLLGSHNVCWVACPTGLPSSAELLDIQSWLGQGNKTLVITYPDEMRSDSPAYYESGGWAPPDIDIARNVFNLCGMLGLDIKPIYLSGKEKFATRNEDSDLGQGNKITLNTGSIIITGCEANHTVETFYAGRVAPDHSPKRQANFIPLEIKPDGTKLVTYPNDISDAYYTPASPFWQIKSSIAEVQVPIASGSGYRIFWNWVSETPGENRDIKIWLDDVKEDPHPDTPFKKVGILDYDKDDKPYIFSSGVVSKKIEAQSIYGKMYQSYVDVRAKDSVSGVSIFFDGNDLRAGLTSEIDYVPKTMRIFSVSGALIPINAVTYIGDPIVESYIDHYETSFIHHPASSVVVPTQLRPIMTNNTKYCSADVDTTCKGFAGQLIADGPMVAAEEPEHFSSFKAGAKRSSIVVISDATILQGDCPEYRNSTSPNVAFIKSLYPSSMDAGTDDGLSDGDQGSSQDDGVEIQNRGGGRQFKFTQKLLAPERGSPHKYQAASGLSGLTTRFGGSLSTPSLGFFTDDESVLDPLDVYREADPTGDLKPHVESFEATIPSAGAFTKISGIVDGAVYSDIGPGGGMPKIKLDTGSDYLDFTFFESGYPGDLFGYSISMHSGKLIVGTPFNGFDSNAVIDWDDVVAGSSPPSIVSGLKVSYHGGGGAAFYFERTNLGTNAQGEYLPWEFKQKMKPSGVNVGHDNHETLGSDLIGNNNYLVDDLTTMLPTPDRFGYSVSLDADFAAVGAPGHDFENVHEHIYDNGAFLRKEFDFEFDIPLHNVYDMGISGTRDTFSGSGNPVLNNGAVFTFEHRIVDWPTRTKSWVFAEKVVAQGYNSRLQKSYSGPSEIPVSGSENDHFGEAVSIHRARRGDGDYTLAVGAKHHMFATSGDHISTQPLPEAGAAYTFDAMLREQPPSLGSPDNWIQANVFGDSVADLGRVSLSIYQDVAGSTTYRASGTVFSNNDGEIFLEASGHDPATKGFIENRSYINLIYGDLVNGIPSVGQVNLYSHGSALPASSNMPMHIAGPNSNTVYNSVGLYSQSAYFASGDMTLYTDGASGIAGSGQLWLHTSGTAFNNEQLNLRIRGK